MNLPSSAPLDPNSTRNKSPKTSPSNAAAPPLGVTAAAEARVVAQFEQPHLNPPLYIRRTDNRSIMYDHKHQPLTVDRYLATRPLQAELSSRPGPNNKRLTYLSGETVTRILNEIFGYDGWNLTIVSHQQVHSTEVSNNKWSVTYVAHVRITLRNGAFREDVGSGEQTDRQLGTAIQLAMKGAVTDALKRAARHWGDILGNSLYDGTLTPKTAPKTVMQALEDYDAKQKTKWDFGVTTSTTTTTNNKNGVAMLPPRPVPPPPKLPTTAPTTTTVAVSNPPPPPPPAASTTHTTKTTTVAPLSKPPGLLPPLGNCTTPAVENAEPSAVARPFLHEAPPPTAAQRLQTSSLLAPTAMKHGTTTLEGLDLAATTTTTRPGTSYGAKRPLGNNANIVPPLVPPTKKHNSNPYVQHTSSA